MGAKYFGASVLRREDPPLLRGAGRYVDDVAPAGLLHAAFLRSPHAHARLRSVNLQAACALPGVVQVYTFEPLAGWMQALPTRGRTTPALAARVRFTIQDAPQYPLAHDRVRYVGEIVAMVVATSRHAAENALDLIEVDYEPLPAVVDALAGAAPDAPRLHPAWRSNVALSFGLRLGDPEQAVREAEVVVRETFTSQRYVGMPMEPRGVVAEYDRRRDSLTSWSSTQIPHFVQEHLAGVLGLPVHRVRVIAPDVGGGFGTKAHGYAEDVLVPLAARLLGRPVKWVEDRHEHFMASAHARQQTHQIEVAAGRDGVIHAVRDAIWVDLGAYNLWHTLPYNSVGHLLGPHRVKHLAVEVRGVVTNKTPHAPYRGAGRPEAVFAMDRIVDCLARELGLDPAEVRRRNYLRADELPYEVGIPYLDGSPLVYDSGDFAGALEQALAAADYAAFRAQQADLRARGVYRGIGISGYVEGTGLGPYESASVRVDQSGRVLVATGAASQGQGLETAFAQIAADALDVPLEWITVVAGDTDALPFGLGAYASRQAVLAGSSILDAATRVRQQLVEAAARLLEVAPADVSLEDGHFGVRGVPGARRSLAQVVQSTLPTFAAAGAATSPEFSASAYHRVPTVTFASGVHVAQVEVDPGTGLVKLLDYVVAHDCGRVINPRIVEGQVHGGVAQGIGGALLEELVYDEQGQLLTGSLMDYLVPTAMEIPPIRTVHLESPSPRNPLGVKGVGEGGAISPPAAIANAVEDALAPFGVRLTATPVTPDRIVALLAQAEQRA